MKKVTKVILSVFLGLALFSSQAFAEEMSNYDLMQEIKGMKKQVERLEKEKEMDTSESVMTNLLDKVTFSGAVELDYSYAGDTDAGDNTINDSTSDLDVGTVELGAEIALHDYVTGNVMLKGENLDTDDNVFCDEAVIDMRKEDFPIYFVGGKRGQPFGVFESHLITDPLTQDLYEIADIGATLGFTPGILGMDISATLYKGETLMTHMLEGAYGLDRTYLDGTSALPAWRTGGMSGSYEETDDVSSYTGNITLEPVEGVSVAAFYNSEPGDKQRNNTLGGMFHCEISKLTLDMEYITAAQREADSADNKAHKENALSGAIAFQVTDSIEIALRYEVFDDDIPEEQDGHLDNRYSLGLNYGLFEKDNFATGLSFEYRQSSYEKAVGSTADDSLTEFFAKLAIEF
jgi:hypothetical protein